MFDTKAVTAAVSLTSLILIGVFTSAGVEAFRLERYLMLRNIILTNGVLLGIHFLLEASPKFYGFYQFLEDSYKPGKEAST